MKNKGKQSNNVKKNQQEQGAKKQQEQGAKMQQEPSKQNVAFINEPILEYFLSIISCLNFFSDEDATPKLFGLVPVPQFIVTLAFTIVQLYCLYFILHRAYDIRTIAIQTYGRVIHEFDPWFNYRATEYLEREGWEKFFSWFDYMSWYPLGRPVGS
jgi:asparagine N-glycosylation enzyme membrane subunit Stt3